jgi:hypothetical protein
MSHWRPCRNPYADLRFLPPNTTGRVGLVRWKDPDGIAKTAQMIKGDDRETGINRDLGNYGGPEKETSAVLISALSHRCPGFAISSSGFPPNSATLEYGI